MSGTASEDGADLGGQPKDPTAPSASADGVMALGPGGNTLASRFEPAAPFSALTETRQQCA